MLCLTQYVYMTKFAPRKRTLTPISLPADILWHTWGGGAKRNWAPVCGLGGSVDRWRVSYGHEPNVSVPPVPLTSRISGSGLSKDVVVTGPCLTLASLGEPSSNTHVGCQCKGPLGLQLYSNGHIGWKCHNPVYGRGDGKSVLPWLGAYLARSNWTSLVASERRSANSMYLPVLIAWTRCLGMGGRPELGRKRPFSSSVLTEARGCYKSSLGYWGCCGWSRWGCAGSFRGSWNGSLLCECGVGWGQLCRHGNKVSHQSSDGTCKGGMAMLNSRPAAWESVAIRWGSSTLWGAASPTRVAELALRRKT